MFHSTVSKALVVLAAGLMAENISSVSPHHHRHSLDHVLRCRRFFRAQKAHGSCCKSTHHAADAI